MRTPDEIKKGLECCSAEECTWDNGCPYMGLFSECNEGLKHDALAYIQQLEAKVPRWISVEERLPEAHKNVLVYMTNPIGWWKVEIDWMDEQGWVCSADTEWHTITHWMPLPEVPKEG